MLRGMKSVDVTAPGHVVLARGVLAVLLVLLTIHASGCVYPSTPPAIPAGQDKNPSELPATEDTRKFGPRLTEFGVLQVRGPVGRGLERSGYEACIETQQDDSVRREVIFLDDNLVTRSETLRTQKSAMTQVRTGNHLEYRSQFGKRRFTATIDGSSIRHSHDDPFRGSYQSPEIPTRMESPRILDPGFVSSFQELFYQLLAALPTDGTDEEKSTALDSIFDSLRVAAISPRVLGMVEYRFGDRGREVLRGESGEVLEAIHLRVEQDRTTRKSDASAVHYQFWILEDGTILRMEAEERGGRLTAYNLAYFPGSAGAHSEQLQVGTQTAFFSRSRAGDGVDSGHVLTPSPALLVLDEPWTRNGATASSGFAHRVRWGLARAGLPSLGFGVDSAADGALSTAEKMLSRLRERPEVDAGQIFVLAYHRTLSVALALAEKHGLRGVIVADGEIQGREAKLSVPANPGRRRIPVRFLWGPGPSELARSREELERTVAPEDRFDCSRRAFTDVDRNFWPVGDQPQDLPRQLAAAVIAEMVEFVQLYRVVVDGG